MKNRGKKVSLMLLGIFTVSSLATININYVNAESISNDKKQSLIDSIANKIKEEGINEKLIKDGTLCDPDGEYVYQLSSYLAEKYISYHIGKVPKIGDKLAEGTSLITDTVINTFEYGTKNYREYVCEYGNTIIKIKAFQKDNKIKIQNIIGNLYNENYTVEIPKNINIDKYDNAFNTVYKEIGDVSVVGFSKFFLGKVIDGLDNNIIDFNYFNKTLKNNKNKSDKIFDILINISKLKNDYNTNIKNYNTYKKIYDDAVNNKNNLNKEYQKIITNLNSVTKQFQNKYKYELYKQYTKDQVNDIAMKSELYKQLLNYTNQKSEYNKRIKENDLLIGTTKKQIDASKSNEDNLKSSINSLIKNYNNIK